MDYQLFGDNFLVVKIKKFNQELFIIVKTTILGSVTVAWKREKV